MAELAQLAEEAEVLTRDVKHHKSEIWRNRRRLREKMDRLQELRALLATAGVDVQTVGEDEGDCHGQKSPSDIND